MLFYHVYLEPQNIACKHGKQFTLILQAMSMQWSLMSDVRQVKSIKQQGATVKASAACISYVYRYTQAYNYQTIQ